MKIDDGEITDVFLQHFGHVSLDTSRAVFGFDDLDLHRLYADLSQRLTNSGAVAFHFLGNDERCLANVILQARELGRFDHDLEAVFARMSLERLKDELAILITLRCTQSAVAYLGSLGIG